VLDLPISRRAQGHLSTQWETLIRIHIGTRAQLGMGFTQHLRASLKPSYRDSANRIPIGTQGLETRISSTIAFTSSSVHGRTASVPRVAARSDTWSQPTGEIVT
jgi:hypothetical protein